MPNRITEEISMYLKKFTEYQACFIDKDDRIGKIYLPIPMVREMGITDKIMVQLAAEKSILSADCYVTKLMFKEKDCYVTRLLFKDKTTHKIKFTEDILEKGGLGQVYVKKDYLKETGLQRDEIAIRVIPPGALGGAAVAR